MPEGQQPLHDDDEAVHHQWMRPAEALALNETDEMLMMTNSFNAGPVSTLRQHSGGDCGCSG